MTLETRRCPWCREIISGVEKCGCEPEQEIGRLRDALDSLEVQGVRGILDHWVSVPEVEWDAVMAAVRCAAGGALPCQEATAPTKEERRLRKELHDLRQLLQQLSNGVLLHLDALDKRFRTDHAIPRDASAALAKLANALEMANDRVRYRALGVDFRNDDKAAAVRKLQHAPRRGD